MEKKEKYSNINFVVYSQRELTMDNNNLAFAIYKS